MTTRKGIRGSLIGKPRICVRLQLVQRNHCSTIVLFLESFSTYSPHINLSGQDSLTKISFELQYFSLDLRLARKKKPQYQPVLHKMRTAGYRLQTEYKIQNADCRLGTKCRLRIYTVFSSDMKCHHLIFNMRNIRETIDSFARGL